MFEKLNTPLEWKNSFTKYPHGLTIFEAICNWAAQVDLMIDHLNLTDAQISKLFTDTLPENVEAVLNVWLADGTLSDFISVEMLDEVDQKLKKVQAQEIESGSMNQRSNRSKQALISFVDDDGATTSYNILRPIGIAKNIPICMAIYNGSGVLAETVNGLLDLQDNHGWEVIGHGVNHVNLTTLSTEAQIEAEVKGNKEYLQSFGFNVENFAYPQGGNNNLISRVVSRHYRSGLRAGFNTGNTYPLVTMDLQRVQLGGTNKTPETDTIAYYKGLVDAALTNKQWLIFMTHAYTNTPDQNAMISELITYIQSLFIPVVNIKEGLQRVGNTLEARSADSTKYLVIDVEGNMEGPNAPLVTLYHTVPKASMVPSDFPDKRISIAQVISADAAGFPATAGTVITNRLNVSTNDESTTQMFIAYDNPLPYVRRWTGTVWTTFVAMAASTDVASYANVVPMITSYRQLGTIKVTKYLEFVSLLSVGGTTATLSKKIWSKAEISTSSAAPTTFGTAGAVSLQGYIDASGYLWLKYSASGNNYDLYVSVFYC